MRPTVFFITLCSFLLFPRASSAEGNRYALVVGISGYPHFKEPDQLHFADSDADLFRNFIQTDYAGRFAPQNIKYLVNADASRVNIYDAIKWIGKRAEQEDRVYIFFAGHGIVDDLGIAYLMPYDSDPDDPAALGIPTSRFIEELRQRINARRLVVFIDACHSGALYSGGMARDGASNIARPFEKDWEAHSKDSEDTDAICMALLSASSSQRSYEDPTLKHGVFTYFLVEGLKGKAAHGDGVVTAGEVYRYVLDTVEDYTKNKMRVSIQSPFKSPQFVPTLPLAIVREPGVDARARVENAEKTLRETAQMAWRYAVAGMVALNNGDDDQALSSFHEAIKIDPGFSDVYVDIGYIYMGRFNIETAVWNFRKALEYDPNSYIAHNNLGFCYEILMNFSEAISHLQKSYGTVPTLLAALNLGDSYRHSGDFGSALYWHRLAWKVLNDSGMKDYQMLDYLGSAWIYNYMPLKPGDTETINCFVKVRTPEEKRAFLHYALSFDCALTKDFKCAGEEFERAMGLRQAGDFGQFFVNRIQYIGRMHKMDAKTNAWFERQKVRLLSR
jgi:uncharacterized caspase-like protein